MTSLMNHLSLPSMIIIPFSVLTSISSPSIFLSFPSSPPSSQLQSYGVPFGTEWSDPTLWVADTFPWVEWKSRDKLQNITEEDVGLSHGEGVRSEGEGVRSEGGGVRSEGVGVRSEGGGVKSEGERV